MSFRAEKCFTAVKIKKNNSMLNSTSFKAQELNKNYKPKHCWDHEMSMEEPRIVVLGSTEQIIADIDPKQEVEDRIPLKLLQEQAVREEIPAIGIRICSFPKKFLFCKSQEFPTVKTKPIRITLETLLMSFPPMM